MMIFMVDLFLHGSIVFGLNLILKGERKNPTQISCLFSPFEQLYTYLRVFMSVMPHKNVNADFLLVWIEFGFTRNRIFVFDLKIVYTN